MELEDGTGSGYRAKVGETNRLYTNGLTQDIANYHNTDGDRYNINTDDVVLTSASESAILYIKNTSARDIVLDSFVQILGGSTGGSGQLRSYVYRNPTGGTIVSAGTATSIVSNLNYGSNNSLTDSADILTGGEGKTQTGGEKSLTSILTPPTTNLVRVGDIILTRGTSCCITITPPSGNTNMVVQIAILAYLLKDSLK